MSRGVLNFSSLRPGWGLSRSLYPRSVQQRTRSTSASLPSAWPSHECHIHTSRPAPGCHQRGVRTPTCFSAPALAPARCACPPTSCPAAARCRSGGHLPTPSRVRCAHLTPVRESSHTPALAPHTFPGDLHPLRMLTASRAATGRATRVCSAASHRHHCHHQLIHPPVGTGCVPAHLRTTPPAASGRPLQLTARRPNHLRCAIWLQKRPH